MCLLHSDCFFFTLINTTAHTLLHVHVSAFLCGHCVFPGLFVRSLVGTLWAHKRETATVSPPESTRRGLSLVFRILSSPTQDTLKRGLLCGEDPGEWRPAALQRASVAHSTVSMCVLIFVNFSLVSPQLVNKDDTRSSCLWESTKNLGTRVLKIVETK